MATLPRIKSRPLLHICESNESFRHGVQRSLWKIMAKYECPPNFITMVRQFQDGMQARVLGELSSPFPVPNWVKQGCVPARALFSIMFSAVFNDAFRKEADGLDIK